MKTHEFANALMRLGKLLQSMPDVELADFEGRVRQSGGVTTPEGIAVNISTLAALSRIDKQQWLAFIQTYKMPIAIRQGKDASRDILGKVLRYLEDNPEVQEKLKQKVDPKATESSPELMRALNILLKGKEK